jgi:hypothetical protein
MSAAAPAIQKAAPLNLADELGRQMTAIRNRHYFPLGYMMRVQLGISDESAYFQEQVRSKLGPLTRIQGLTLDWNQECYPMIAEIRDGVVGRTEQFVFPRGVERPPKISDPRVRRLSPTDPLAPMIPQDVDHYASGVIFSRAHNETFRVLQPVEQIAIRVCATFLLLRGRTNPANGTKVALLYNPRKNLAFLVGGLLTFD